MMDPVITGDQRVDLDLELERVAGEGGPKRIGQIAAEVAEATRKKYGRSPANAAAKPLPGHENDVIPELPNYYAMKDYEYARLPVNRADERQRLVPSLPRKLRLLTYTRQRLRGLG